MDYKKISSKLGFVPKENTLGVFRKQYLSHNGYSIEIDFEKELIHYGDKIKSESKTTQNFSQAENWVVLECVDRLLEKGYPPQNITLEKTWKTGHGTSGRLDIFITRDDDIAYLMIECKTWEAEFDKEFKNLEKNGGQLFTYFQQDKNAEVIMLYASALDGKEIKYINKIVKIEEDYRQTANVKDFFERWNKSPKTNGIFDRWASAYEFQSKALIKKDLKVLKQEDSSFIFNRFLEILRHNVVSDKPNAFNKIFTLFLCKIVDEDRNDDEQLHFQWLEGEDSHISFQKRMTDLYNRGMLELLEKKVTDVSDKEFDKRFQQVDDKYREQFKEILTEIRLKKNNEFAIKEVYDDASFQENAKVVKEVVELLQVYQIRYNYRQQFLSDFFELLLTTGLKQESGQFFTPVPIARFIIKSLPFQEITKKKLEEGNKKDLLPTVIDYATGSGHFITESMEEVQKYIDKLNPKDYNPSTRKALDSWQKDQFDWAEDYVYGVEKDYRLVKTAKVSCYLHGDGLAKVIHGDGLGDFTTSTEFKDLLTETDKTYPQDNKQFDVVISNPPYSVSAFKGLMGEEKSKIGFDLYKRLTDQSSEIECLFIERTKQLLKDGGVAGIILPSSILSNTGIYTQTREILLEHFDILAIAEMGSNTFMATGTNTVTLFLRRRNNADATNIKDTIKKVFVNLQDVTINGIETPISKYVAHVWDNLTFEDYKTLLQKTPNKKVEEHEIYQEYKKKIKAKSEQELSNLILALEQDKLVYFIITYPQKIVLFKTGSKNEEKRFLGYEFSNRRGSEGIHPIQRSKSIDECTQLYDANSFVNFEKVSTYIYKAFNNEFDLDLPENLKQNVSYQNLANMLTFDRVDFEKTISLSVKKKVKIGSKYESKRFDEIADIYRGVTYSKSDQSNTETSKIILTADNITLKGSFEIKKEVFLYDDYQISDEKKLKSNDIFICFSSGSKQHLGKVAFIKDDTNYYAGGFMGIIRVKNNNEPKYFFQLLNTLLRQSIRDIGSGSNINNLSGIINEIKIPLPPKEIQKKIVAEIEVLENQEQKAIEEIDKQKQGILSNFIELKHKAILLGDITSFKNGLNYNRQSLGEIVTIVGVGDFKDNFSPNLENLGKIQIDGNLSEDYELKQKDILVVRSNGSAKLVGRFLYLSELKDKTSFSGFTIRIRVKSQAVDSKFLCYYLKTDIVRNELTKDSKGSNIKSLNQGLLSSIKIPLLPIEEQKKIVALIEKAEQKIIKLEKNIELIPKQKETILKKYLE
ncbi:MAG: restriction endonuclease subunit S [Methylococcales bacterium]|nr:restriction endonuclease subunit S [Methylococcales bacterium]